MSSRLLNIVIILWRRRDYTNIIISRGDRGGNIAGISRGYREGIAGVSRGNIAGISRRGSCEEVVCNGDVTHGSSREVART